MSANETLDLQTIHFLQMRKLWKRYRFMQFGKFVGF
jgi:hypothetical protein